MRRPQIGSFPSARTARELRRAIDEFPSEARWATVEAIDSDELVAGAYVDRRGRTCPLLAVHRRGLRVHAGRFPSAWDSFCGARRPRPATVRELQDSANA